MKKIGFKAIMKLRRRQSKERCRKSGLRESTTKTGGVGGEHAKWV